ncbi:MAG: RluA family pseudouridine synthase [Candidatus Ratteibacteria bacterium]|nr:RluA family pseudouridine synthase [Candidatus Ratteibacteria bacterium]
MGLKKLLIYRSKGSTERIDTYLKSYLRCSREKVKELLKTEKILVRNKPVSPSYILKDEDEIMITETFLSSKENNILPEQYPLDIIYNDDYIIVVNKPPGILTHPTEKDKSGTMVNFLMSIFPLPETDNILRPGVVHRLDRETSGVMVFAKTYNTWVNLTLQFKNRMVKKEYIAIVKGRFYPLRKEIEFTVAHNKKTTQK